MKFKIMNRKDAIQYTKEQHEDKSILISISNTDDSRPQFDFGNRENNVMSILYMQFDDIQKSEPGKYKYFFSKDNNGEMTQSSLVESSYRVFNEQDAKIIYDFVVRNENKVDTIIVHCAAGRSRSAGCCAAIMLALEGDDSSIFNNGYYHPNMTVYTELVKEFAKNGYNGVYGKHFKEF